jgi:hypothetical protein
MLRPVLGRGRVGNFLVRNKWRNYEAIQRCRDLPMLLLSSLRARASLRPGAACACLSHAHPAAGELAVPRAGSGGSLDACLSACHKGLASNLRCRHALFLNG